MTDENARLRDTLKAAESVALKALHSQPDGDEDCRRHLLKAIVEVKSIVAQEAEDAVRKQLLSVAEEMLQRGEVFNDAFLNDPSENSAAYEIATELADYANRIKSICGSSKYTGEN